MNIRKQIDEVIEGLSPGECIEALGIMISDIERETEKMSKLARQVFNIPICKIDISPSHPFYVENDDDMKDLVQSIIKYGMITPGTVRTKRNHILSNLFSFMSMSCFLMQLIDIHS